MSDDGTRLAAALGSRLSGRSTAEQVGHISIRDGGTGSEIRRIESPGIVTRDRPHRGRQPHRRGIRRAGEPARTAQSSGQAGVKIWDTSTGELVQTLPMLPWTAAHNRILWSPDGARLLRQSVLT